MRSFEQKGEEVVKWWDIHIRKLDRTFSIFLFFSWFLQRMKPILQER